MHACVKVQPHLWKAGRDAEAQVGDAPVGQPDRGLEERPVHHRGLSAAAGVLCACARDLRGAHWSLLRARQEGTWETSSLMCCWALRRAHSLSPSPEPEQQRQRVEMEGFWVLVGAHSGVCLADCWGL